MTMIMTFSFAGAASPSSSPDLCHPPGLPPTRRQALASARGSWEPFASVAPTQRWPPPHSRHRQDRVRHQAEEEVEGAADAVEGAAVQAMDEVEVEVEEVEVEGAAVEDLHGSTLIIMSLAASGGAAGGRQPKAAWKPTAYARGTLWAASAKSKNTACAKDSWSDVSCWRLRKGPRCKLSRS